MNTFPDSAVISTPCRWCPQLTESINESQIQSWVLLLFVVSVLMAIPPVAAASDKQPVGNSLSATRTLICRDASALTQASTYAGRCELLPGPSAASSAEQSLCRSLQAVQMLVMDIRAQHTAIAEGQRQLETIGERITTVSWPVRLWRIGAYLLGWTRHQLEVVSHYWRIGSLESTLLIAYSKLGAARRALAAKMADTELPNCQLLAVSSSSAVNVAGF